MDLKQGIWIAILVYLIHPSSQRAIDLIIEDVETTYIELTKEDLTSKVSSRVWYDYELKGRTEELVKLQLDMVITKNTWLDLVNSTFDMPGRRKRNAVKDHSRLWPRRIPYKFGNDFSIEDKYKIVMAMKHWEEHTCLEFVEAKESDFDVIEYYRVNNTCESMVGRAQGPQPINLAEPCMYKEILVHEIGHALGLFHEHMRADRDDYVTIQYENIDKSRHTEFDLMYKNGYDDHGKPYDHESIMHYGKLFFSLNRTANLLTIVPKDPKYLDVIGEVMSLSFHDIKIVNEMYKCSEGCADKFCPDDGFLGKNCQCYCMGNTTQDVVSCHPKTTCGKLDIDLNIYGVYTSGYKTKITDLEGKHFPDQTCLLVEFEDQSCGPDVSNFTCVNGEWDGELPECKKEQDCVYDGHNADVIAQIGTSNLQPGQTVNSRLQVRVYCRNIKARMLKADEYLECQDGVWSKDVNNIKCIVEHPLCPMVANATLRGSFESGFEVECVKGFELQKYHNRFTCSWNGSWEPFQPVCVPAKCRLPQDKDQRRFYDNREKEAVGGSYVNHGSDVSMWCPKGHIPDDIVLTCSYGAFNREIPECTPVYCQPPQVTNLEFEPVKKTYLYGDEVKIGRCDKMLEFVGSRTLVCQKNGTWSDDAICREFCPQDIVKFVYNKNEVVKESVWKKKVGVGTIAACERTCLNWKGFLCRAFVYGFDEDGSRHCLLYPYSPEEYPAMLEPKLFWTVGVRKCESRG